MRWISGVRSLLSACCYGFPFYFHLFSPKKLFPNVLWSRWFSRVLLRHEMIFWEGTSFVDREKNRLKWSLGCKRGRVPTRFLILSPSFGLRGLKCSWTQDTIHSHTMIELWCHHMIWNDIWYRDLYDTYMIWFWMSIFQICWKQGSKNKGHKPSDQPRHLEIWNRCQPCRSVLTEPSMPTASYWQQRVRPGAQLHRSTGLNAWLRTLGFGHWTQGALVAL